MKKKFLLPLFILILASGLRADEGCGTASDACRPQIKTVTPFMAELEKAQTASALKPVFVKELSLIQGGPKERLVAPATTTVNAAPAAPTGDEKNLSHPAWLLAGAGLLAGLYYFLKGGRRRGKN